MKGDPLQPDGALEHSSDQGSEQERGTRWGLARQLAMERQSSYRRRSPELRRGHQGLRGPHCCQGMVGHGIGWKASHRLQ